MFTREEIEEQAQRIIDDPRPIHQQMWDAEIAAGRRVLLAGLSPILPICDWEPTSVVSQESDEVRLILLHAKRIGGGAFKRALAAIREAGLRPVVVGPIGPIMPAMMKRWGWVETIIGEGWDAQDEWRPPEEPSDG